MPAIQITNKNINLDITDQNDNVLGQVSFNPKSIKVSNAFSRIYQEVAKLIETHKAVGKIEEVPTGKLDTPEAYRKAGDTLEKVISFTDEAMSELDKIGAHLDEIFGTGTYALVLQGSYDVEALFEFLEGVTPYFRKAQAERVGKYLDDKNSDESDVM